VGYISEFYVYLWRKPNSFPVAVPQIAGQTNRMERMNLTSSDYVTGLKPISQKRRAACFPVWGVGGMLFLMLGY